MYSNEALSLASLTSNVVRNVSLHVGTPFDQINDKLERGLNRLHGWIGIDMNDRRTTWLQEQFHIVRPVYHEDTAANPIHLFFIVLSTVGLIIETKFWKSGMLPHFLAVYAGFLLFCLFLKWQPWHSRLHLPLFVLWAPLVSMVFVSTVKRRFAVAVMLVLTLSAIPPMLWNQTRPLIGEHSIFKVSRDTQYFSNQLGWREPYLGAAGFLVSQKCRQIGVELGGSDWEYPLWVALRQTNNQSPRIEHINVLNSSSARSDLQPFSTFSPCAVVSRSLEHGSQMEFKGELYTRKWSLNPINVFLREPRRG